MSTTETEATVVAMAAERYAMLDLTAITPSRTNPRLHFNEPRLAELAESIRASGVHQAILVRPLPATRLEETFTDRRRGDELPTHEIVAGERRYRASKLAGKTAIPALIRHMSDEQVLEAQLTENLQRDDLHPMEEAEGYERLCNATGISKEEAGAKIGRSRAYIYARLKLLALSDVARAAFYDDKIDASRALVIARIPDATLQAKALEEATRADWQGHVLPFRAFVRWAQQNVMLRLDGARFDITQPNVVPNIVSCKECPLRTGAAPDLFADVDSADICTNPPCFQAKTAAHEEAVLAVAKAKGQKVIGEREAKELWPWEHSAIKGYVRVDRPDERVGGSKTLKTILGKDMPEPILMQNPHKGGELISVLPADKVSKMLKDSGRITPQQARSQRVISATEAERNALAKFEKTWRKRAIAAVHSAMADQVDVRLGGRLARVIGKELLSGLRSDERQHVCELLGLGKVADQAGIEAYFDDCSELEAEKAMLLLLMQHDMLQLLSYATNTPQALEAKRITAVAEDYEVALPAIRAEVQNEFEEAALAKTPPVPEPKSEESDLLKPKRSKKIAPPTAHAKRGKKPSAREVQAQVAEAFQALEEKDQAPGGAAQEEESAAPAAQTLPLGEDQTNWPFPPSSTASADEVSP